MRETKKQDSVFFSLRNKKVPRHIFCLATILLLFLTPTIKAQSGMQAKATFTFKNEKLSDVLQKISDKNDLNFSYDAGDPVFNKRINFSTENESVDVILEKILAQQGLRYEHIGNQLVILRARKPALQVQETSQEVASPLVEKTVKNKVPEQQTEYVLDTIMLHDTISRIDTIRITDTVFVEKEKPQKQIPAKIKELPVDYFQPETIRDKGWAMGVFVAPVMDDFSLVKNQKSFSLRSFSLGVDALKLLKRWNLQFGLRLTQFDHRFTQHYTQSSGGLYDTDTIDIYYTLSDNDTTWYYVTDSSWIPLDVREFNYQHTNTLGYFVMNFSASFDVYQNNKIRVYLKAGAELDLLIYKNGLALLNGNPKETTDFNDLNFNNINYAFSAGAGLKYRLADKVDFNTELYYARYLNDLVSDIPLKTKINALGLKMGLIFYF